MFIPLASDRVANGVAYLDQHVPGWANYINVDSLDICNGESCVLGQLGRKKYSCLEGENPFVFLTDELDIHYLAAESMGFAPYDNNGYDNDVLTELWRDEVNNRKINVEHKELIESDFMLV